jgi:5-methylthioribose kinase
MMDAADLSNSGRFLEVHGDQYWAGRKIGDGSFGVVFQGERQSEGIIIPVAIKFVRGLSGRRASPN